MRDGYAPVHLDELFVGEVRHVAAHDPVGESLLEVRGIHEFPSGEVQEHGTFLHDGELIRIDGSTGVLVQRHVQGDEVGVGKELFQARGPLGVAGQHPCRLDGQERIVPDDLHAQALGGIGHHGADGTQADHAHFLAEDLGAAELGLSLLDQIGDLVAFADEALGPGNSFGHLPAGQQHAENDQFLHAVGVRTRGIEHHNALLRALVDGDVVYPGACAGDGLQTRGQGHVLHLLASYQDAVGL